MWSKRVIICSFSRLFINMRRCRLQVTMSKISVQTIVLFSVWCIFYSASLAHAQPNGNKYQRFCFIDSESQYRPYEGQFNPNYYNMPGLCTHLVYNYAAIDVTNFGLAPNGDYEENNYQAVTSLKNEDVQLKVLLGVGGPSRISEDFTTIVNDTDSEDLFIQNTAQFLRDRFFDGIMLDWMYPGIGNSPVEDVGNYTQLIKKMLEYFEEESSNSNLPRLLLTVAVSGERGIIDDSYEVEQIAQNSDYLLVKTYDFYTADIPIIGHHSALLPRQDEQGYVEVLNVDFAIQYLLYLGVPQSKLILGIPTHGRTLQFLNSSDDTQKYFGYDHGGPGEAGPYTQTSGLLAYYEICSLVQSGWVSDYDLEHQTPFAYSNTEIVTFDDVGSVVSKVNYMKDNKLGGAFISSLDEDDFNGFFCDQGQYPLTQALKTSIMLSRDNCKPGSLGSIDEPGCFPCAKGSYQPKSGQTSCVSCPEGMTTATIETVSADKCVADCPSGQEYSQIRDSCDNCKLGYFRDANQQLYCEKCPPGFTTVSSRSAGCVLKPDDVVDDSGRQVDIRAVLVFDVNSCENKPVIISAIKQVINQFFDNLSQNWPSVCHADCDNVHAQRKTGCSDGGTHIKSIYGLFESSDMLEMEVLVENISEEANDTQNVRMVDKVVEEALYETPVFNALSKYGITYKGLTALTTHVRCGDGYEVINNTCYPCQRGHFHNKTSGACDMCPIGSYQSQEGMVSCVSCDGVKSTRILGATSPDVCTSPCEAKPNYCYNNGRCHWNEAEETRIYCECSREYVGDRCDMRREFHTDTGTIVGASVGAIIGFLLLVLIIIAFLACVRYSKVGRRSVDLRRRETLGQSNSNNYVSWPGKSYASNTTRGVKFVDYIDYYTWLYAATDRPIEHQHLPVRPQRTARRHRSAPPSMLQHHHHMPPAAPQVVMSTMLNGDAKLPKESVETDSTKSSAEMIY